VTEERWPHDRVLHAWWVIPGRLLAGEYPSSTTPRRAMEKMRLLVEAGVDSIVDLTTAHDPLDPYDELLTATSEKAGRDVRHFRHPIPDMSVIDDAGYDRILARIRAEMDAGRTVYVHCWAGKGRTSTVIGCLLADEGLDYDATIARIAALRAGTCKASDPCPESPVQRNFLRTRCARNR
jgi:protein-tyrosine phosphatase